MWGYHRHLPEIYDSRNFAYKSVSIHSLTADIDVNRI